MIDKNGNTLNEGDRISNGQWVGIVISVNAADLQYWPEGFNCQVAFLKETPQEKVVRGAGRVERDAEGKLRYFSIEPQYCKTRDLEKIC